MSDVSTQYGHVVVVYEEVPNVNFPNSDVDDVIATFDAHLSVGRKSVHHESHCGVSGKMCMGDDGFILSEQHLIVRCGMWHVAASVKWANRVHAG